MVEVVGCAVSVVGVVGGDVGSGADSVHVMVGDGVGSGAGSAHRDDVSDVVGVGVGVCGALSIAVITSS